MSKPKDIFVIGSSGQDGQILCEKIAESYPKHQIIRVSSNKIETQDISITYNNFRQQKTVLRDLLIKSNDFDVFFLASKSEPDFPSAQKLLAENPLETIKQSTEIELLEFVIEYSQKLKNCESFFYASSCLVFGDPMESPQTENTARSPKEKYSQIKEYGSRLVLDFGRNSSTQVLVGILYSHESVLRPSNYLFPRLVDHAWQCFLGHEQILEFSDLSYSRDWLDADDVVNAILGLVRQGHRGEYLIGSGRPVSIEMVLDHCFSRYGLDFRNYVVENRNIGSRYSRKTKRVLTADTKKLYLSTNWEEQSSIFNVADKILANLERERKKRDYEKQSSRRDSNP